MVKFELFLEPPKAGEPAWPPFPQGLAAVKPKQLQL